MKVGAIVVNWNGGGDNLVCLRELERAPLDCVIFVDNASSDGSLERVRAEFPALTVLANDANLGFGAASNQGAAAARARGCEALLFVNNDVRLPAEELRKLVAALEGDPRLGFVGPRVLDAADRRRIWAAGGRLSWRQNLTTLIGQGELDGARFQTSTDVDYVVGCALLARAEVFEACGGFDAGFFAYSEDVDLALRAKALGFRSRIIGEAFALHSPSSSTGGGYNPRRKYMMGVNSVWFLRRHGNAGHWIAFLVFDVATLPILLCVAALRGRARAVAAKGLGILHGLLGRRVDARALESGGTPLW